MRPITRPEDIPAREVLLSMSGLEFMQGVQAGTLFGAGIAGIMGMQVDEVAEGFTAFTATPDLRHVNPVGAVHGGWYGTLLDSAMGCAVMTCVPRGSWYTTLEYKVNLIRALPLHTQVRAEARVDHAGRSPAVAHGEIRDDAGKLYATGSTTCIILAV